MVVKDIMTTKVVSIAPGTLISEAAEILHKHQFSALPVVNEYGLVVGLVGERELFSSDNRFYLPMYINMLKETDFVMGGNKDLPYEAGRVTRMTAEEIMNRHTPFAEPNLDLERLAARFALEGVNTIPVVDQANKLLGIVTRSDLLKHYAGIDLKYQLKDKARHVDDEIKYVQKDLASRYAFVAKSRANVWVITAAVLFIIGFVAGIIYVVNPQIFGFHNGKIDIQTQQP